MMIYKNYFPIPNEIFALDLSAGEIAIYSFLLYCEDRKTFQCYPSYKTIGSAIKLSRKTVSKYVKKLEEKKLIITEPTKIRCKDGRKRNGNLLYNILPISEALDFSFEKQMKENEKYFKNNDL